MHTKRPSMEHERPQHMIDFDEDLVGDVSMRPNDALLTSYGRHTRIPGERSRKQPARARTRNSLLFITPSVDLLKGSRPTTNLHGVRQRCTRILGTPEPRCTSLQKRRDALNLSNQHLVQSEVVVSCSNLLNNTETKTRSVIDLPWYCINQTRRRRRKQRRLSQTTLL